MAPLTSIRRSFKIRQDPTRAKSDWVYSELEVTALYGVSRNTTPNWVKAGLRPVLGHSPRLFHGTELNRFHRERRERAKRPSERDELYCISCKAQQPMAGRLVTLVIRGRHGGGWLRWPCPECDRTALLAVSSVKLERLSTNGVHIASAKATTD